MNSTDTKMVAVEDYVGPKLLAVNDYQGYNDIVKYGKALLKFFSLFMDTKPRVEV